MKIRMLAGAAAVAALIATPIMIPTQAQSAGSKQQAADSTGTKKVKKMHQSRIGESRALAREDRSSGFWPADVAAGVVGGAVNTAGAIAGGALNTAGAIATAPFTPFRGDSYAYYRDPATGRGLIADYNGPSCMPGSVVTINGQRMRCQ